MSNRCRIIGYVTHTTWVITVVARIIYFIAHQG